LSPSFHNKLFLSHKLKSDTFLKFLVFPEFGKMQVSRRLLLVLIMLIILGVAHVHGEERELRSKNKGLRRPRTGFPTKAPTVPPSITATTPKTGSPTPKPTDPPSQAPTNSISTSAPTNVATTVTSSFKIDLVFQGEMTTAQQQAFIKAAARLQSVIDQDFATDVTVTPGTYCGYAFPTTTTIDDVMIAVKIGTIDGPGGILGQAGPCLISGRGTSVKARFGVMQFDSADVDAMSVSTFDGVAMHEMVHVLGLGTLWESGSRNLIAGSSAPLLYTGTEGNIGHTEIGGTGSSAIVEDLGGPGTARGHFKESVYGNELMTGWASSSMPMSKLTVRALRDLGFSTDLSKADPFSISSGRRLRDNMNKKPLVSDMLKFNLVTLKGRAKPGRTSDEHD
jgi:hypothetical protein